MNQICFDKYSYTKNKLRFVRIQRNAIDEKNILYLQLIQKLNSVKIRRVKTKLKAITEINHKRLSRIDQ